MSARIAIQIFTIHLKLTSRHVCLESKGQVSANEQFGPRTNKIKNIPAYGKIGVRTQKAEEINNEMVGRR